MRRKQIPLDEGKPIYEELVRVTVQKMAMSLLVPAANYIVPGHDDQISGRPLIPVVTHRVLHDFTVSLFEPGLEEQRDLFIKIISSDAMAIEHNSFTDLWIPLLQDLLFACEKFKISLSSQTWQQFYQAVLKSFLLICVGKPPKPNLAQNPVLGAREEVNQFLVDSTRKVARLCMTETEALRTTTKIARFCDDYTWKLEPQGHRRYVLIITKKDKKDGPQWSAYEERKLAGAKRLYAFDQQKLRTVLAGEYEAIMTMSVIEVPEDAATTSSLDPIPANPAEELARLDAEMERLVNNNTPPNATVQTTGNRTIDDPSRNWVFPSQTMSRSRAAVPTRTFTMPQRSISGASRVDPPATRPVASSFRARRGRISSTPVPSTRQRPPAPRGPRTPVTTSNSVAAPRSVSWSSRRPPSTVIPHPVAGAKRKMVELIDLTLDDD